jgi:hypothetical protein
MLESSVNTVCIQCEYIANTERTQRECSVRTQ